MTNRKVWLRRVAWASGTVVLLFLMCWLAVPPLLKWQGEKQATAALGREVRIGAVHFVPWKLAFTFDEVRIAPASTSSPATSNEVTAAEPLLTVARVHVDFAAASLWKLAPVIQALDVDALHLTVTRTGPGRYDIDDLIQRFTRQPASAPSDPIHFALYNVQLHDAAIRFDDRPAGQVHQLNALHLAVPFLSNLPAQVDIRVEPHLSFLLNGVPFDSGALATPFAKTRSGELTLKFSGLELAPYLGYLPDALPVRILAGRLSTDLAIEAALPPGAPPVLRLRGSLDLQDVHMTEPTGAPLLTWRRLDLTVREAAPLARHLALSSLRLEGARLTARRDGAGMINLLRPGPDSDEAPSAAHRPPLPAASMPGRDVGAAPGPWRVELDRVELVESTLNWHDASVHPAATLQVDGLNAALTGAQWPIVRPIGVSVRGRIRSAAEPASPSGGFSVDGSATDQEVKLKLSLASLSLDALDGYVAQSLTPQLAGRLSAQARIEGSNAPGAAPNLVLSLDTATIDGMALRDRAGPGTPAARDLAALNRLAVTAARIDVPARAITVDRLAIDQPSLSLTRDKAGEFDVSRWPVITAAAPPASSAASRGVHVSPWRILLREAALTSGRLQFADAEPAGTTAANPLRVAVADLRVAVQNLAWEGDRPTVPAQIEMSGRVGPPRAPSENGSRALGGGFDWRGVVGTAPLLLTGSLKLERVPVHLFMPYVGSDLALQLARAELGYSGNLSVRQLPTGLDVDAGADVLLGAVRVESRTPAVSGETLLSWNTLGLKSVRFSMKPGGARPTVDIAQAALDNFYSRLVITEDGRLNLSSVAMPATGGGAVVQTVPPASAKPSAGSGLPIDIRVDGTSLTNGRLDFSDHFVRPNYSAALTELNGRLGGLQSGSVEMAPLSLRGKAAGTALLDIEGKLNPFARPLTLDLHAKATDLELAPLSPYAGKYAGYAIERGKMSMDVAYRLDADGRLEAKNQVVLNQLTFGAKIDSPAATQLPVLLAVALLKDRNGVIDLNLPISGSINDPQFSVGGIVARLLGNLLVKAITSPFALLTGGASAGDRGPDPGQVEFVPGTTRLASAGLAVVDKVAQALAGKSNLMLTVTGTADPAAEQEAYRSAALDDRLEAARRKQTVASAAAASAPLPPLGSEARGQLVKALYQESDLPDKPRNVLGFAKDVPAAEMETRLKAIVDVGADAMRELALQRGVTVRDTLIARGLPSERLFLSAPQLRAAEPNSVPAAQLSLTVD